MERIKHYKAGQSCLRDPKRGKHDWVPRATYRKCRVCGSEETYWLNHDREICQDLCPAHGGFGARNFWVVSPNVRNDPATAEEWKRDSIVWKAAFMGHRPSHPIGKKFAKVIKPNDIILIARSHDRTPDVAGFGIVRGPAQSLLKGFTPPPDEDPGFKSFRKLRPFVPMQKVPDSLRVMDVLKHKAALRKLEPAKARDKRICRWLERRLGETELTEVFDTTEEARKDRAELQKLAKEGKFEYEVRAGRRIRVANRREMKLVLRYERWLKKWGRNLRIAVYRNLRCDAYEPRWKNLVEAKSSITRQNIRMAAGQLLDYAYQGRETFGEPRMAILLPEKPKDSDVEWLSDRKISLIWEERGSFVDNAGGAFTAPRT
jgi:hypothetical protein